MNRYLLGFLLIAGMASGQNNINADGTSKVIVTDTPFTQPVLSWGADGTLAVFMGEAGSNGMPPIKSVIVRAAATKALTPDQITICSAEPREQSIREARLIVMQKALDYIAKMAARNPHEEQDAGEFLERMGRILAGSEGK